MDNLTAILHDSASHPAASLTPLPAHTVAVLFFSLRTEGTLDKGSLHGSCPTLKGTKYAATKWVSAGSPLA